jgi:hypothetical protein
LIVVLIEQVLPTVAEAVETQGTLKRTGRSLTVPATPAPLPLSVILNVVSKRRSST